MPDDVSYAQEVRIVVKYLKDNPKLLNKDNTTLVWLALEEAYHLQVTLLVRFQNA